MTALSIILKIFLTKAKRDGSPSKPAMKPTLVTWLLLAELPMDLLSSLKQLGTQQTFFHSSTDKTVVLRSRDNSKWNLLLGPSLAFPQIYPDAGHGHEVEYSPSVATLN